jgi:hypothetical protein
MSATARHHRIRIIRIHAIFLHNRSVLAAANVAAGNACEERTAFTEISESGRKISAWDSSSVGVTDFRCLCGLTRKLWEKKGLTIESTTQSSESVFQWSFQRIQKTAEKKK